MSTDAPDTDEPPIPAETRCPGCGSDPTDESARRMQLSNLGYLHQDIKFACRDCNTEWICGVPIGEFDRPEGDELWCSSCDESRMLVHRVVADTNPVATVVTLHLKCPNCFAFTKSKRKPDSAGVALVGYPATTGETADAEPFGYRDEGD